MCPIAQACSSQDHLQGAGGEPASEAETGRPQPGHLKLHGPTEMANNNRSRSLTIILSSVFLVGGNFQFLKRGVLKKLLLQQGTIWWFNCKCAVRA